MTMGNSASVIAYIAMGSNLGERRRSIHVAVLKLRQTDGINVRKISAMLDNPAVGGPPDSPNFLNAVVEIQTLLSPRTLLQRLLQIEKELGRTRRVRWEPRIIDLDILLYGDQIVSGEELVIPHPLLHERKFVLEPLAEIASDVVHPVLQMTIGGLLEDLLRKEGKTQAKSN
jgi:2-amino-4-hydroxy-6-hydroxymethyldihydropteridine diphosphokinase